MYYTNILAGIVLLLGTASALQMTPGTMQENSHHENTLNLYMFLNLQTSCSATFLEAVWETLSDLHLKIPGST